MTATLLVLLLSLTGSISAFALDFDDVFRTALPTQQQGQESRIPQRGPVKTKKGFSLKVGKVTTDSAVLRWESDSLILSYTVCKYNDITRRWEEYANTTEQSMKVKGLEEDRDYRFAVYSSVSMEPLAEVGFTTEVKTASVAVTREDCDAITLRVRKTDSVSTVVLYKSTDKKHFKKLGTMTQGQYVDRDVKANTAYYYRVSSVIRRGGHLNVSKKSKIIAAHTMKNFGLPAVSGETKTYAFYTAVTATGSPQYKLLHSPDCYTDEETGIRMVDGYYCIALGSYYGTKIGSRYRITLQDGDERKEINCILCDQKANVHTDGNNQYAMQNKDIMEFYIERSKLPGGIQGNYGRLKQFRGKVVKIEGYVDAE